MELERKLDEIDQIVNKLKFDLLKCQLIGSKIATPDTLNMVTQLIFDNAVVDPTLCPLYAQLCSDLSFTFPSFSYDESDGRKITFKRLLLNKCQETFESAIKLSEELRGMTASHSDLERIIVLRIRGNICFIGELFMKNFLTDRIAHEIIKKLLPIDSSCCSWDEEKVDAVCQFLNIVGKKLDSNSYARGHIDTYFDLLKKISTNQQLSIYRRSMVHDVINLRSNNWVPRQKKTIYWQHRDRSRLNTVNRSKQKFSSRHGSQSYGNRRVHTLNEDLEKKYSKLIDDGEEMHTDRQTRDLRLVDACNLHQQMLDLRTSSSGTSEEDIPEDDLGTRPGHNRGRGRDLSMTIMGCLSSSSSRGNGKGKYIEHDVVKTTVQEEMARYMQSLQATNPNFVIPPFPFSHQHKEEENEKDDDDD